MWEATEAQGVHIVGCICDDDAATLLSGWPVLRLSGSRTLGAWGRNTGGAEGGGEPVQLSPARH